MSLPKRAWVLAGAAVAAASAGWLAFRPRPLTPAEYYLESGIIEPVEGQRAYLFSKERRQPWMEPLNDPSWLQAAQAVKWKPDDPVVGLALGDGAWALPWWVLKNHHVANLTLAGRFVLLTFCDQCSSSSAFDPVVDGRRLLFYLVGIRNGTILVADEQTGSWWSPFTGEATDGPLTGTQLERVPVYQCTWAEWLEEHPASLAVEGSDTQREGHAHDAYPGADGFGPVLGLTLPPTDDRYPAHELVLGATVGDETRAYPIRVLDRSGSVLNDSLGDRPIVVLHRPGTLFAVAWSRVVDGRTLTFAGEDGRVTDRETGTAWSMEGRGLDGPLAGTQLEFVSSGVEEWYIWAIQHPKTGIRTEASTASP